MTFPTLTFTNDEPLTEIFKIFNETQVRYQFKRHNSFFQKFILQIFVLSYSNLYSFSYWAVGVRVLIEVNWKCGHCLRNRDDLIIPSTISCLLDKKLFWHQWNPIPYNIGSS